MNFRRAILIAVGVVPFAVAHAAAQVQPAPTQQMPPCVVEFLKLRDDAAKKANAIRVANQRKVPPPEACKLFTAFSAAEEKMLKYAEANTVWCGIPEQAIHQIKQSHVKTAELRTRVCQAAAMPQRPAGPTLSDSLAAPVTDANNIKTGRGTFDTLTGAPIGSR